MKRQSVVKTYTQALNIGDVAVFIGESLCNEAQAYDREGNLYLSEYNNAIGIGLGIAMCSDRRVFIFCNDSFFFRNLSDSIQVAVSKCKNIFIVLFISGTYSDIGKFPTLYNSINSVSGVLFNSGFMVHNYNRLFRNIKNPVKEIKAIFSTARGPLVIITEVDCPIQKQIENNSTLEAESIEKIRSFIINKDIPSFNFIPPISLDTSFFPIGEE
jgi:hypothetical protein